MNAVVIPIYRETPKESEIISLKQAFRVFKAEKIRILTYKSLNINQYENIFRENMGLEFDFFDPSFFISQESYNSLLLQKSFYDRYLDFEYILIYQTDSIVFRNELNYWVEKAYDYIGAPWIKTRNNKQVFDGVGNGGFSLRKVSSCRKILDIKPGVIVKNSGLLFSEKKEINSTWRWILDIPQLTLRIFGYKNTFRYYLQENLKKEDVFWGTIAPLVSKKFRVPDPLIALGFAFEREPKWSFSQNHNQLPFGAHAWDKYEPTFWKKVFKDLKIHA